MKRLLICILICLNALSYGNDLGLVDFNGQLRIGYIYTKAGSEESSKGVGFGGSLHMEKSLLRSLTAGLTFYTVNSLGFDAHPEFYGSDEDGISMVSEAYGKYIAKGWSLKGGRFLIDTPHADSDDIRMIPNAFEGVEGVYESNGSKIVFAHLSKMAGWESGDEISSFKPLYQVLGLKRKTDGMNILGIAYSDYELWLYNIDEIANVLYMQAGYIFDEFSVNIQADLARDTGSALLGEIQSDLFGMMVQYDMSHLHLSVALNRVFGDTAAIFSFGGGPYFTSMEDQTIDAAGKDAKAYTFGMEYEYEDFVFGVAAGKFEGDRYKTTETDLSLSATLTKNAHFECVYAKVDDRIDDGDLDLFRIIMKYSF